MTEAITPQTLAALVQEFRLSGEDLAEAVLDAVHDQASDRYNGGACDDLDDEQAHDAVHDDADEQAGHINAGGAQRQLAYLAEGCRDLSALRSLLNDLLTQQPDRHAGA